jgi:hypothetical protein
MTQAATQALTMQNLEKLQGTAAATMAPVMLDAINASETFKGLVRQAIDKKLSIDIDNRSGALGTAEHLSNENTILFSPDLLEKPVTFLGILAHELGHFEFATRGSPPDISKSFAEHVALRNATEAHGDTVAAQIRKELARSQLGIEVVGQSWCQV